uniref:Methyltransferase HEMK2 n=1 Tax=Parastrongyloides trichosuri TaxID=131310 RepID=A0A0N4ZKV3_PARTI
MSSVPTPNYSLGESFTNSIYDPSNDTFLLMDVLEKHKDELLKLKPLIVFEIGSGTGVVSSFLRELLKTIHFISLTSDVNFNACLCTQETSKMNNHLIETICCDTITSFEPRLNNKIDLLIFNPPYVLTNDIPRCEEELCYAGGPNGRYVLDKLLPKLKNILCINGRFYVIAVKDNDIEYLVKYTDNDSLKCSIAGNRIRGCENLFVLMYERIR